MNPVEIEQAISALAEQPFDPAEFPYLFLQAFGNKETTLKRLRKGESNKSDLGGVLQTSNIHIAVAASGEVTKMLAALKASPATAKAKAKFILATDGDTFEAEDLTTGEIVACPYNDFPDHFGFFLSLAGITTVERLRESSFDIRATSRLNRLYVELLKDNPAWGTAARGHDMNHFMARLIFCFFAEDTDIFRRGDLFTDTVAQMSEKDSSNTHEVIETIFGAMNTKDRAAAKLPRWADAFPYVNGGLFSGSTEVPKFSKIARSYLIHIGNLDWKKINPDIFGSMIQAVADEEERGALGMHYTSVPNILKVLNPLFLDDLRAKFEEAGTNPRTLLNLRKRMAKIRVFDPACGSGNFLVIAYKEMRAIEAEINNRRGEADRRTEIPLTNFRGIELRDFPAEIARLALIIAEFQCDVLYRGQKEALQDFLPLDAQNWITCGNALRLDWLSICPPTGAGVKYHADDLLHTPLDQAQIDFENEGGETYICGNPPYLGTRNQNADQKVDMAHVFESRMSKWKSLDYVSAWFIKGADFLRSNSGRCAFVATNSICQGQQAPILWPEVLKEGCRIAFAHRSFKWSNNASNTAAVVCVIVAIENTPLGNPVIFDGELSRRVSNINFYLAAGNDVLVAPKSHPISSFLPAMEYGNKAADNGSLILSIQEAKELIEAHPEAARFIRRLCGSQEFMKGADRFCLWIPNDCKEEAVAIPFIRSRVEAVRAYRLSSRDNGLAPMAERSHQFREMKTARDRTIIIPGLSSERREYLPIGLLSAPTIVSLTAFAIYDGPMYCFALISSKMNFIWNFTISGKMKTDVRYSNSMGWHTFPVPTLTDKNKTDLTRCAEDILLVREAHFPATIADLYDPEKMPADLREAHERNDEVLERIYIGRRFRNDTERLEKLFELYMKMTAKNAASSTAVDKRLAKKGRG